MTDTTTAHPRQLRLPGQVAAHGGPIDLVNMYLAHHGFRRDLTDFAKAVPVTPVEDRDAWRALARRWSMFAEVLHHHHKAEDDWLWPMLTERTDAEGRATLAAMEAEHGEIDPTLEACAAGFERLAHHPDPDARAALSVRLVAAKESLGRHLAHEENDAIRIVQAVLTTDDWAQFEKRIEENIKLTQVLQLLPWVMHKLPAEARKRILETNGKAHRVIWMVSRPRFERIDRRAFRHLPA